MNPFQISFSRRGEPQRFNLVGGENFDLDVDAFEDLFSGPVSTGFTDLLRIALSVYVADRLLRRTCTCHPGKRRREIDLTVEVLSPERWNGDALEKISECLSFITDDIWNVTLNRPVLRTTREYQPRFTIPPEQQPAVCLYSGGLDSGAGLASRISRQPGTPMIPVTVWHQGGQRRAVRSQFEQIRRLPSANLHPLIVKTQIYKSSKIDGKEEPSQRSRSFLFCTIGAIVASLVRAPAVEMYESGIGAINLPLLAGMTGSKTTRSSHPQFLRRMSEIVSHAAESSIEFQLPFLALTKGQLVSCLKKLELEQLARLTVSCSKYPLREKGAKQCGFCSACIFRRQAMLAAGIEEAKGTYKVDLFQSNDYLKSPRSLEHLKAFLIHYSELGRWKSDESIPAYILNHLRGTKILKSDEPMDNVAKLYRKYRNEWSRLIESRRRLGVPWTGLIDEEPHQMQGVRHVSA